ncbi:hypothetical protein D9758_012356 [Tetrapyrgos nigripes]|uniref:Protein-S-isoprenylcysteine O-methyltransferase n=1 Tax=Tetrapyrgos nigripes TaxID=182062 RepID=A0A8H5FPT3_9AGAR|nr:hypothetical protein D9758_012356 [Tetrapyrgos nigripes]
MKYLAGINLAHTEGIEAIVVGSTLASFWVVVARQRQYYSMSDAQGGRITSSPASILGRLVTPFHAITVASVPLSYLAAVLFNRLEQPRWLQETGLLSGGLTIEDEDKALIRTLAAVGVVAITLFHDVSVRTLGKQMHYIGVREKAQVVTTGPYAYVRHPIYT